MVTGFSPTRSAGFDFWNVNRLGKQKAIAVIYCCSYTSATTVKQSGAS